MGYCVPQNGQKLTNSVFVFWLIRPFGVRPRALWIRDKTRQGYERDWFTDAWDRYLQPQGSQGCLQDKDLRESAIPKEQGSPWVSVTPKHPHNSATLGDLGDGNPGLWDYEMQERAGMREG